MAKRTKTEMLEKVKSILGDRNDDEALEFIADISDSVGDESGESRTMSMYNDLSAKYSELETKYNKLDNEWRDRYKARFYDGASKQNDEQEETSGDTVSINDLFKRKEH